MPKFKIGDKLRCVETDGAYLNVGDIYIVKGFNPTIGVLLEEFPTNSIGFFERRFVLVNKPFNVNKATDKEIADEYRRLIKEARTLRQALLDRGFKFFRKPDLKPVVFCEIEDALIQKEERVVTTL